ncbi:nuclear transport factor 2 family protein [Aquimarina intermedia]|uniref:Putative lumazine-binding protein n=1 Tax=Aquimarina intermedia TaxID=350814 RepID=A0A5S5BUK4_9FLAO|nr:nuclear transport factor 2 family protein [Aquimarina intermedia]TYP70018.1 putative lumazine-binding protein [Aquimarina intermedia]
MKIIYSLSIALSFLNLAAFAQAKNEADPTANVQKEVKQTILEFFDGFHNGDTTKIYNSIEKNMTLQTIIPDSEGGRTITMSNVKMFVLAIHNKQQSENWKEELLDIKIEATENIAHVWTPYNFYLNDTLSHCGVNSFQLYNNGTSWKIIAIADTRNQEGCIATKQ